MILETIILKVHEALKSAGIECDDPAAGVRELAAQRDRFYVMQCEPLSEEERVAWLEAQVRKLRIHLDDAQRSCDEWARANMTGAAQPPSPSVSKSGFCQPMGN